MLYRSEVEDYGSKLSSNRLSTSTSSPAPPLEAARPRHYCDTTKLLWGLAVAVALMLFIGALIHNMEPAFVNPVMQ